MDSTESQVSLIELVNFLRGPSSSVMLNEVSSANAVETSRTASRQRSRYRPPESAKRSTFNVISFEIEKFTNSLNDNTSSFGCGMAFVAKTSRWVPQPPCHRDEAGLDCTQGRPIAPSMCEADFAELELKPAHRCRRTYEGRFVTTARMASCRTKRAILQPRLAAIVPNQSKLRPANYRTDLLRRL
jgi:hypothetical protein